MKIKCSVISFNHTKFVKIGLHNLYKSDFRKFQPNKFFDILKMFFLVDDFAVIGVSLYYKSVEDEINQIGDVHQEMKNRWGDISTLIMGDFMTGGG